MRLDAVRGAGLAARNSVIDRRREVRRPAVPRGTDWAVPKHCCKLAGKSEMVDARVHRCRDRWPGKVGVHCNRWVKSAYKRNVTLEGKGEEYFIHPILLVSYRCQWQEGAGGYGNAERRDIVCCGVVVISTPRLNDENLLQRPMVFPLSIQLRICNDQIHENSDNL